MIAAALGTPRARYFDANGDPLAGGLLYTYVAGTDTPQVTYTTGLGDVENTNPVVLDANGEASIYLAAKPYKFVLKDSLGVTQWTEDPYYPPGTGSSSGGGGGGDGGGTGDTDSGSVASTNFADNGGLELLGYAMGGVGSDATGATATNFRARWWGWRGGASNHTITHNLTDGFPRSIKMQRNAGDTGTTPLVIGQHTGYSGLTDVFLIFNNRLNPTAPGIPPQVAVLSAYVIKGNDHGGGVTIELVSNVGSANICSGSGWTVEASTTLSSVQLATGAWTRVWAIKSGAFAPNSVALGIRIKYDGISGTAGSSDYLLVAGVKLELSDTGGPSAYLVPQQAEALARARRFYQRVAVPRVSGYGAAGGNNDLPLTLETQMMSLPLAQIEGAWTLTNCSAPTLMDVSHYGATLRIVSTALGQFGIVTNSPDDFISFNAETQP